MLLWTMIDMLTGKYTIHSDDMRRLEDTIAKNIAKHTGAVEIKLSEAITDAKLIKKCNKQDAEIERLIKHNTVLDKRIGKLKAEIKELERKM